MAEMEVDRELIKKVATTARLKLTDAELDKFVPQIKEVILDSFNKLDEVDAKEDASFQPLPMNNKFREDEPKTGLSQEDAMKNVKATLRENGYLKGPKAL